MLAGYCKMESRCRVWCEGCWRGSSLVDAALTPHLTPILRRRGKRKDSVRFDFTWLEMAFLLCLTATILFNLI